MGTIENVKSSKLSRRSFLQGASLAAVASVSAGMFDYNASVAYADAAEIPGLPEAWDAEADIVAVGYGAAGAACAICAADEELGSCIVLEVAPEGEEGGNSRVCGQNILIPEDAESAIQYQKALNSYCILSDSPEEEQALYEAWANEIVKNKEWLEYLGAVVTPTNMNSHEFPEIEGNEKGATCYLIDDTVGNEALWNVLKEQEEYYGLDIRYGTRAVKLVRNPLTNECLGVVADQDGQTLYIKANKGVVLSCGGFENNPEMMRSYSPAGVPWTTIMGTQYNRGDGFKLVAPFGAELWHMNNFTGLSQAAKLGGEDKPWVWQVAFGTKDFIYTGPDAKRYMNEEITSTSRHGKLCINGTYQYPHVNTPSWIIFSQDAFNNLVIPHAGMGWLEIVEGYVAEDAAGLLEAGIIKKADTPEELAELIGYNPTTFAETIATYNQYAADGYDPDFHRGEPIHEVIATGMGDSEAENAEKTAAAAEGFELVPLNGPYYAIEFFVSMGNTQGGPKRGVGGEVIDVEGNPVPRLYAAGEFGCIYAYQYNGGGNVSEAMSSGRIAARSIAALEPWDSAQA